MRIRQPGFTLIEMIMVIAITGILVAMVAIFIKPAIDAYFDQSRRAELTDIADTALRRMTRDLRLAVPNTVRVSADTYSVEFLLARTGGRYRYDVADEPCFTSASGCSSITTRGSVISADDELMGNSIVIFNQYNNNNSGSSDCSATNPSAYCGHNTSPIISPTTEGGDTDTITFTQKQFLPLNGSATRRFQVMEGPVTFVCDTPGKQLTRSSGYALRQHISGAISGGISPVLAVLAGHVSDCSFTYQPGAYERWGVVGLNLTLTMQGESVSLYQEVHVDNSP